MWRKSKDFLHVQAVFHPVKLVSRNMRIANRGQRETVQQSCHCLPSMIIFINTIQHQTQWMQCTPGPPHSVTQHNQTYCEMSRKHKCATIDCDAKGLVNTALIYFFVSVSKKSSNYTNKFFSDYIFGSSLQDCFLLSLRIYFSIGWFCTYEQIYIGHIYSLSLSVNLW